MLQPNLVDDILDECEDVETPREWIYWAVLATIGAAAGSNYYLKAFNGKVTYKPNMYVILMGESGLGKQFPVSLARSLTDKADVTRLIYGRSSIQAIVRELSHPLVIEGKLPIEDARCFIVNGELSTAIIQDPDSLTILTDIWDPLESWTNKLKGDGNEKLFNLATSALFGTSPAHFYESIPQVNIEGGYIGRNLIIRSDKRYKDLDMFTDDDHTDEFPYGKFVPHLVNISNGGGRVVPNSDAKEILNKFRREWRTTQQEDRTGFVNRVPDHIIKVAMCLCLADYEALKTLVITADHMQEAIDKVVPLVHSSKSVSAGMGTDPLAKQTKMVLDFLLTAKPDHMLTRKQLLSRGYGHFDAPVLDRIIKSLVEMNWVKETRRIVSGRQPDVEISLTGEPLRQYQEFMRTREVSKG